jgi:hypothetical protein
VQLAKGHGRAAGVCVCMCVSESRKGRHGSGGEVNSAVVCVGRSGNAHRDGLQMPCDWIEVLLHKRAGQAAWWPPTQ